MQGTENNTPQGASVDHKRIITISRQFACRGTAVAKRLSELLGMQMYSDWIAEETASRLNIPLEIVNQQEETARVGLSMESLVSKAIPLFGKTTDAQDKIFQTQQEIIRELADEGNCILVGRCSEFVLDDDDEVMCVHLYATYGDRLAHCMDDLGMEEHAARQLILKMDEIREAYCMEYTGYHLGEIPYTDVMMDVGFLGVQGTAQALAGIADAWFSRQHRGIVSRRR